MLPFWSRASRGRRRNFRSCSLLAGLSAADVGPGRSLLGHNCPISMIVLGSMLAQRRCRHHASIWPDARGSGWPVCAAPWAQCWRLMGYIADRSKFSCWAAMLSGVYMSQTGFTALPPRTKPAREFRPKAISFVMARAGLLSAIFGPRKIAVRPQIRHYGRAVSGHLPLVVIG